jgi:hypothetical protein
VCLGALGEFELQLTVIGEGGHRLPPASKVPILHSSPSHSNNLQLYTHTRIHFNIIINQCSEWSRTSFLFHSVQAGIGANTSSYPMGSGNLFRRRQSARSLKPALPKLRKQAAIAPYPTHLCVVVIKHRGCFCFVIALYSPTGSRIAQLL